MPDEPIRMETDQLSGLYKQLGTDGAEDVVCRAVEELAFRLKHCDTHWQQDDNAAIRKCARSMIAIAEQLGMTSLAIAAGNVTQTIDQGDEVAKAATLTRLFRIGEQSLMAVWDVQDMSLV